MDVPFPPDFLDEIFDKNGKRRSIITHSGNMSASPTKATDGGTQHAIPHRLDKTIKKENGDAFDQYGNGNDEEDYDAKDHVVTQADVDVLRNAIEKKKAGLDMIRQETQTLKAEYEHLKAFANANKSVFKAWKQKKADDLYREIQTTQAKLDALIKESEDYSAEYPFDDEEDESDA